MTLNRFFLLFLAFSFIIYFAVNPYVIDQKKLRDIPQLEFKNFVSYEIEGDKLKLKLFGESAKRYESRFRVRDFAIFRESNNTIQVISALEGLYKDKQFILNQSVHYQGKDNLNLETERAQFDLKHNTIDINVPFTLTQNDSILKGSALFFNQNNDKIKVKDVNASFLIK